MDDTRRWASKWAVRLTSCRDSQGGKTGDTPGGMDMSCSSHLTRQASRGLPKMHCMCFKLLSREAAPRKGPVRRWSRAPTSTHRDSLSTRSWADVIDRPAGAALPVHGPRKHSSEARVLAAFETSRTRCEHASEAASATQVVGSLAFQALISDHAGTKIFQICDIQNDFMPTGRGNNRPTCYHATTTVSLQ